MKATGIVRRVDELGRIVLPIELRRVLGIEEKDALEIYTDEDAIVLKKYDRTISIKEKLDSLIKTTVNEYGIQGCQPLLEKLNEFAVLLDADKE